MPTSGEFDIPVPGYSSDLELLALAGFVQRDLEKLGRDETSNHCSRGRNSGDYLSCDHLDLARKSSNHPKRGNAT